MEGNPHPFRSTRFRRTTDVTGVTDITCITGIEGGMKRTILCACVVFAGCHALPDPVPIQKEQPPEPVAKAEPSPSFEEDDGLTMASRCLERGDSKQAVQHLRKHIASNPDQVMIRAYLAELLMKSNQIDEARTEFTRFIADAQEQDGPAKKHLVHCHTRLMEIAVERDDEYSERLHRAIGLILLARHQVLTKSSDDESLTEQMLFKAVSELQTAQKAKPTEARPSWYLYEAFTLLNQRQAAEKALRVARSNAAFAELTPTERQSLAMTDVVR